MGNRPVQLVRAGIVLVASAVVGFILATGATPADPVGVPSPSPVGTYPTRGYK